jgi:hypothetical protein
LAIATESPSPKLLSTFSGITLTPYAMPATPMPLLVACAIVPVTCVPWP